MQTKTLNNKRYKNIQAFKLVAKNIQPNSKQMAYIALNTIVDI